MLQLIKIKKLLFTLLVHFLVTQLILVPVLQAQEVSSMSRRSSFGLGGTNSVKGFSSDIKNNQSLLQQDIPIGSIPAMGAGSQSSIYYNIHVLGEVPRPGTYKILPSDRVTDALRYAGELLPSGSERSIQLRRVGAIQSLDIYRYKHNGDLAQNPYLMENDVVFVPLKKGEVQIEGPVNRPGNYEILRSINLNQLIKAAGGFVSGRSTREPIRVIRFDNDEKKQVIEIDNSEKAMNQFFLKKGDIVLVPHVLTAENKFDYTLNRIPGDNIFYPTINENVNVIGAVNQPGPYPFQPGFGYRDYIGLAGPTNQSGMDRTKIISADGKKRSVLKVAKINPGDTIIVPSKTVTLNNFLLIFNTVTNMFLTTIAVKNNLE